MSGGQATRSRVGQRCAPARPSARPPASALARRHAHLVCTLFAQRLGAVAPGAWQDARGCFGHAERRAERADGAGGVAAAAAGLKLLRLLLLLRLLMLRLERPRHAAVLTEAARQALQAP